MAMSALALSSSRAKGSIVSGFTIEGFSDVTLGAGCANFEDAGRIEGRVFLSPTNPALMNGDTSAWRIFFRAKAGDAGLT